MPKESFFKIEGRIVNNSTGYSETYGLFVKGLDDRHAVMVAKDYLRKNAPSKEGKLLGDIVVESIQQKTAD